MKFLRRVFNISSTPSLKQQLVNTLGIKPNKLVLYTIALTHSSSKRAVDSNNERLEYLGDAILGAIVANYLFKKYPYKGEGFLTDMRSKMVSRQRLNEIAMKMGLNRIAVYNRSDHTLKGSQIFGNILESLIGAVYLDKGYAFTEHWFVHYIIQTYLSMDVLEHLEINHKNKLISWARKHNHQLTFEVMDEGVGGVGQKGHFFTIAVVLNNEIVVTGKAFNKKDASQIASQLAFEKLGLQKIDD